MTGYSAAETAKIYFYTQILALAGLIGVLQLGLLPALLGGLLVYHLVEFGGRGLSRAGVPLARGKILTVAFLATLVISSLTLGVRASASYISNGPDSLVALFQKMADVVDTGRNYLPLWAQEYLPSGIEEWQVAAAGWLRENAGKFSLLGKDVGLFLAHLLIGMIIGGLVSLNPAFQKIGGPLAKALAERSMLLGRAFGRIVFAQVRISALNTVLTAIFLLAVLPLTGHPMPMTKAMIAVTFIVGLLPIIGNLISNTVIFLIALSVSPFAAVGSLIFLVALHKLEFFVNARIIGTKINARAWEILLSMTVMEAVFGIAGLVAAPIYYSYLKDELSEQKLI